MRQSEPGWLSVATLENEPGRLPRPGAATRRALARIVLGVLVVLPVPPAFAITGGVSVDELLRAAGRQEAGPELVAAARALASVTVALVRLDAQDRPRSLCSATIVHPRVVLTAAHCVFDGGQVARRMIVLFPDGVGVPARRQALDTLVHPFILELVRKSASSVDKQDLRRFIERRAPELLMSDLALVLLHRPVPETHATVDMVPGGFRDDRGFHKLIAGYGVVDKDVTTDVTLPGVKYNEDYVLVEQLQLARFDGKRWALLGEVIGHE